MADRWELFKQFWKTDDEEAVITDASEAGDSMVENSIVQAQAAFKEITDIAVTLSAAREETDEALRKLREAVILSYGHALNGDIDQVKRTLAQVVDV